MNRRGFAVVWLVLFLAGSVSCSRVAGLGSKLLQVAEGEALPAPGSPGEAAELTIIPPPPQPGTEGPLVNVDAEVAILAYHDFSARRETGDMVIHPEKFRKQMATLKSNGISVISMSQYLAWKRGEASVPNPSVVITIDDGWEGVYTDAFPVLKECGFPFSIYLYTNYLGGAGRSLSEDQIREMLAGGCEVGVHSVSHGDLTERGRRSEAAYEAWLRTEIGESLKLLREKFGDKVLPVFAYPYGKYNDRIMQVVRESGYELGITVWGKKASQETPDLEVGRYIIHGNDDRNFRYALMFEGKGMVGSGALAAGVMGGGEGNPVPVSMWPKENDLIRNRTPAIVIDVSALGVIDRDSITLDISGFGRVPTTYDAVAGIITHQVVEPLRNDSCRVWLRLKRRGKTETDQLTWAFQVDRTSLYLREEDVETVERYRAGETMAGS